MVNIPPGGEYPIEEPIKARRGDEPADVHVEGWDVFIGDHDLRDKIAEDPPTTVRQVEQMYDDHMTERSAEMGVDWTPVEPLSDLLESYDQLTGDD